MAIITKQVNGHKYLYEVISWRENGKVKQKWISLGRINDDAVIVKKNLKNALKKVPAELKVKTVTTEYVIRPKRKNKKDGEK